MKNSLLPVRVQSAIACIVLACSPGFYLPAYAADVRYVSDVITLKMYQEADLSQTLSLLKSGDKLVILDNGNDYSQVETEEGVRGWVRSSYLVREKPAVVKLAEVQEQLDQLRSRHADLLIEASPDPGEAGAQMMQRLKQSEAARKVLQKQLDELEQQRNAVIMRKKTTKGQQSSSGVINDNKRYLLLWVIIPLLTLISGFFIGFKFLESRVKARFGGYNPL